MIDITKDDLKVYLDRITEDRQPLWGKMNAQHMVEHLSKGIQLSNGTLKPATITTPEEKLPAYKGFLMSEKPLPQNAEAPAEYGDVLVVNFTSLDEAKHELLKQIEIFKQFFKDEIQTLDHPVFGPLNKKEWVWFHHKHFSHHFSQFGLL